jgi:hypothetical protein
MKSFKEFISEQKRRTIEGQGIESGSITIQRPYNQPAVIKDIPGYYWSGEYDSWGNPIYSPEIGTGISNYDELRRELRSKDTTKWTDVGGEGHGPYMPSDVIDAIRNDPGNMDNILDDYLTPPNPHYGPPNSTL